MDIKESLGIAFENLEMVMNGNIPSKEGKEMIGKINYFKSRLSTEEWEEEYNNHKKRINKI